MAQRAFGSEAFQDELERIRQALEAEAAQHGATFAEWMRHLENEKRQRLLAGWTDARRDRDDEPTS